VARAGLAPGGPLFFMFHIRTKAYYYDLTLTLGGAKYLATGRGFVLGHTPFVQLFRMFANSHFNYGAGLCCHLIVYKCVRASRHAPSSASPADGLMAAGSFASCPTATGP
jgi:hypothetical protein